MNRAGITATALAIMLAGACTPGQPASTPAVAADTITVMAYNIHHGEGMDSIVDLERLARLIAAQQPDLVAVQEVDSSTERTGRVDQALRLAGLTGLRHAFGPFMPYQGGAYGMAVLTRLPVVATENLRLPDGEEPRTALSIRVTSPSGREIRFVGIHFYRTEQERLAQAGRLLELISGDTAPVILAGDFNSEPGTAVIDSLARSFTILGKGDDAFTFPSFGAEREIDFFMIRPGAAFEVIDERVLDEPVASDHRAIVARLVIR